MSLEKKKEAVYVVPVVNRDKEVNMYASIEGNCIRIWSFSMGVDMVIGREDLKDLSEL